MKKPHVLFALFFLLCSAVFAQREVTLSASADKASILIGEPLQLTLQATFSNAHAPSFFTLDSLPHFEVLQQSRIDTQTVSGQITLKQTVTLTSWDSGAWPIPALSLAAVKAPATKPLPIAVHFTATPPAQDYHDIKDIIDVAKPPRQTWYWYVIGAALLLLLVLLLFPKNKKTPVEEAAVAKEGAYKEALKNLDVLKSKNGLDDNEYFTGLIYIFRTYLQHGHGIHSFQQTTGDLSRQLAQLGLPHEDFKKLVETLQLSDFVKFAQYETAPGEREKAWDEIKKNIMAIEQVKK